MQGRQPSISDSASLLEVLLGDASVVRGPATNYKPGPARISIDSEGSFHRSPGEPATAGVVVCKDEYVAQLRNTDGETIAEIKASFVAAFSVECDEEPDKDELEEFAGSTGRLVLRPYAREFMHQMSTRMGIPALTLEVLRFKGTVIDEDDPSKTFRQGEVRT